MTGRIWQRREYTRDRAGRRYCYGIRTLGAPTERNIPSAAERRHLQRGRQPPPTLHYPRNGYQQHQRGARQRRDRMSQILVRIN